MRVTVDQMVRDLAANVWELPTADAAFVVRLDETRDGWGRLRPLSRQERSMLLEIYRSATGAGIGGGDG